MKITLTKAHLKVMRRKQLSSMMFNFDQGILRMTFDEYDSNSGFQYMSYYHINLDSQPTEKGFFHVNKYAVSGLVWSLRPNDEVSISIMTNGNKVTEDAGIVWEMLQIVVGRGEKTLHFYPSSAVTLPNVFQPSKDQNIWNNVSFNQYDVY